MDVLTSLSNGFLVGFQSSNLLYCFIGVFLGTLTGVLPGLGPAGAISLLLPLSFGIPPVSAIILLAGIYYGSLYGGSTTSILINIPGEAASVVTCIDGYQMAKQGRAGPALGIAAFGSFIAGTFGIIGLTFLAYPLARFALQFGPPEYFCVISAGLLMVTYISPGPVAKSLIMALFGLILSCVGMDSITGKVRLTFGFLELSDGFGLVPLVMGLFGVSEVLINLEKDNGKDQSLTHTRIRNLLPSSERSGSFQMGHLAGVPFGFFHWGSSGARVDSQFICFVCRRKEVLEIPRKVRPRSH